MPVSNTHVMCIAAHIPTDQLQQYPDLTIIDTTRNKNKNIIVMFPSLISAILSIYPTSSDKIQLSRVKKDQAIVV